MKIFRHKSNSIPLVAAESGGDAARILHENGFQFKPADLVEAKLISEKPLKLSEV